MWLELARQAPSYDNLRLIAVTNIRDSEKALRQWWHKKYKTPPKHIDDYTFEELLIENFEDFYATHPKEIDNLFAAINQEKVDEWDGEIGPDLQAEIDRRWAKHHKEVNVDKYRVETDKDMSDEQADAIFASIGRDLPGSSVNYEAPDKTLGNESSDNMEFEDDFIGG